MAFEKYYDTHKASTYSQLRDVLPAMRYVEQNSLLHYIGNVKGKTVLDLACGDGIFTRMMMKRGAKHAVGVDISENMISIAQQKEKEQPMGCTFHVADVKTMGKLGDFDLVIAAFLLVYAENVDELFEFGKTIYNNLKPGGYFVSINTNSMSKTFWDDSLKSFGVVYEKVQEIDGGSRIKVIWPGKENGKSMSIINQYYTPEVYEKVFKDTGFTTFSVHDVQLAEEGRQKFPEGYWDEYMANPPGMVIKVKK